MSTHDEAPHSHGATAALSAEALGSLHRGLRALLKMTEGLAYRPLPSEEYPFPLSCVAYPAVPEPRAARADVEAHLADPLSVLENALALLELYEANQPDTAGLFLEDTPFLSTCFSSKRCNGWIAILGDTDRREIEAAINARWQFEFFGPPRPTGVYILLSMLARYAYVYGRVKPGDTHDMGHFVEDFCPGLLICRGRMTDLELTLSLAAMKMGVPAIVPPDYPFPLGRTVRAERLEDIVEAVVGFANIRRLLSLPEIPSLPQYCDPANAEHKVSPDIIWGRTSDSFVIVRKAPVASSGFRVVGRPGRDVGIVVNIDAEPMDAFDCAHIERSIVPQLATMRGVSFCFTEDEFRILQEKDTHLDPSRVGEVLVAAVGHLFPKLKDSVFVEVIFDPAALRDMAPRVKSEKQARRQEIEAATEENVDWFIGCTGCSPFAPDHICIVTPQRPTQCSRPLGLLKTGALYSHDDLSNIHHSRLQRDVNSFQVIARGRCLDSRRGEWSGVNAHAAKMTQGRTRRIFLHSVDEFPQTGCGCFQMILFRTDRPHAGIGIMERDYDGRCPDGRSWKDLHYQLAGKQSPGMTGTAPAYLHSPKFLQADGGWDSVVWVSPKVAAIMGEELPPGVAIGQA